jgi:uncharacterized protein YktB (UPF0637 family)
VGFSGFSSDDFDVFSLPDFDTRMPFLKQRITPKLKDLADSITPKLAEETGLDLYDHVALHLRRSVNPAEETWAAFSRIARAYKPVTHLRVAINGAGIKIACFLEEDADDKPTLAAGLKKNAAVVAAYLKANPSIRSHDAEANYGRLLEGRSLSRSEVDKLADRLAKVKSQHANFSIRYSRDEPILGSARFIEEAMTSLSALVPLYRLGSEPGYKLAK